MNPHYNDTCSCGHDRVDGLLWKIPSISYLKKGDRIRLVSRSRSEAMYATVDMDGHRVSDNYGTRVGNTYYDEHPEKNYINVKFDHVRYITTNPNDTVYERDDWDIYVSRTARDRINAYTADEEKETRRNELVEKLRQAKALVAEVSAELEKLG